MIIYHTQSEFQYALSQEMQHLLQHFFDAPNHAELIGCYGLVNEFFGVWPFCGFQRHFSIDVGPFIKKFPHSVDHQSNFASIWVSLAHRIVTMQSKLLKTR